MRNIRYLGFPRQSWPGILAFLMLVCVPSFASAQALPTDPVDDLQQALRFPIRDITSKEELSFRRRTLQDKSKALTTIGQLRRALTLLEWRDEDRDVQVAEIDNDVRKSIEDRLHRDVREVVQKGDVSSRLAAMALIGDMGTNVRTTGSKGILARSYGPELVLGIKDKDPAVQAAAARATGKINVDTNLVVPELRNLLSAKNVELRRAAAEGLAGIMKVVAELARGQTTSRVEPATRADVVQTGRVIVTAAGQSIRDGDAVVRQTSIEAMDAAAAALAYQIPDPKPRSDFPPTGRPLTAAERTEIDAYRTLIREERNDLQPLAEILNEQAAILVKTLNDPVVPIRVEAARTIENIGYARQRLLRRETSIPPVPSGQTNAGSKIQLVSHLQLVQASEEPKLPAAFEKGLLDIRKQLAEGLKDSNWRVRLGAMEALEMLEADAAIVSDAIVAATQDPNLFVRWVATRTLGKMAPAAANQAVPALAGRLVDPDFNVKVAAAKALERFGPKADAAVPALAVAVNQGDSENRIAAMDALVSIGRAAAPAIDAVSAALQDRDMRVRRAAAEALGRYPEAARKASAALTRALDDPESEVRKAASDALLTIKDSAKPTP